MHIHSIAIVASTVRLVEVDLVCCTVSDCVFLPMPIQYSQLTAKDPFHLVLLFFIFLSSIIMTWFTVFFFEFKVGLSHQISALKVIVKWYLCL